MEKLAIVILNWNGAAMLRQYLPSVVTYSQEEATIYVADNGSTDDSLALLREHFPEVRIIELDRNWGFAEGYNRALAQIDAEYYLLLNSDIEVSHHWLTPLVEFMDTHPEVAACQPKLLSAQDHDRFEYAGASGGFIDRYGYPFCRGRLFDTVERDDGQYDTPTPVHWATGAALLVRARIYKYVGGLDGRFFAHNEEIDLCWRLRIRGYKIYCLPDSAIYHVGGGTLPQGNPRKTFLNFRNNLTMLYKCLPQSELRYVMRVRWLLDYIAAWQMLLLGHSMGNFLAVYRARRAFRRWQKDFDADRRDIQQSRKDEKAGSLAPLSLLWQYYAKGRKTFTELARNGLLTLLFTVMLTLGALPAKADLGGFYYERIDISAVVHDDNTWDVTEVFDLMFTEPRHGFYRYIPNTFSVIHDEAAADYRSPSGREEQLYNYRCAVSNVVVERQPFALTSGKDDDFTVIRIGSANTEVSGSNRYVITYKLTYPPDQIDNYDFVYHTILGTELREPVNEFHFKITFDKPLPDDIRRQLRFTSGRNDTQEYIMAGLRYDISSNVVEGSATDVQPQQGLVMTCRLPNGYFETDATGRILSYIVLTICVLAALALTLRVANRKVAHRISR